MSLHKEVCDVCGIDRVDLAEKLGVTKATLDSWSDESRMSKSTKLALELMIENHYKTKLLSDLSDALSKIVIYDNRKKENDIGADDELKELVARMKRILKEFNLNVIRASKKLNEHSFEQLDQILRLNAYPSFDFLDKFSDTFSISNEWLTTGDGYPFEKNFIKSDTLQEAIKTLANIKHIYIVHSNDNKMPTKVVFRCSNDIFYIYETDFHTEEDFTLYAREYNNFFDLYDFYIKNQKNTSLISLDREEYDKLMSKEYYIGNILINNKTSDMLKDLFDLRDDLQTKYGDYFKECLYIIQYMIKENEPKEPISSVMTNMPKLL